MIFFLYGDDTYRSRRKLKELKEKFLREVDPAGLSLTILDGAKATLGELSEKLSPSSLFTRKRMVVVENILLNKDSRLPSNLTEMIKTSRGVTDNIVVFWEASLASVKLTKDQAALLKLLTKQPYTQEFKALSNTDAALWAKEEVGKRGGNITQAAAKELVSLAGSDLWRLHNEIDKLIDFQAGRKKTIAGQPGKIEIDTAEIRELVRGNFDENIFALTDAIAAGARPQAAKLIDEQRQAGLSETHIQAMVFRQFKIVLLIKEALEQGHTFRKILSSLGLHPFVVQKGISQARNFTLPYLKRAVSRLIKMEAQTKTGQVEPKVLMDMFIATL